MNVNRQPFNHRLLLQADRHDPIGDLAYDAKHDEGFPANGNHHTYRDYLTDMGATDKALTALAQAWKEHAGDWSGRRG